MKCGRCHHLRPGDMLFYILVQNIRDKTRHLTEVQKEVRAENVLPAKLLAHNNTCGPTRAHSAPNGPFGHANAPTRAHPTTNRLHWACKCFELRRDNGGTPAGHRWDTGGTPTGHQRDTWTAQILPSGAECYPSTQNAPNALPDGASPTKSNFYTSNHGQHIKSHGR